MIGKQILHYKITEKLGEGGMGVVYKAEDTKLERTVALKFLSLASIGDEEKKRFKREAKAAASLNHPNIATIFAIDEVDGQLFIAMEFIEGQSLHEIVGDGHARPLPLDKAIDYATQTAAGLQAAHEKGVTHRDIKSANIMVTDKGQIKIMDFGLAKLAHRSKLTQLGTTLGTAAYMSPEQSRGENTDHRSDIWSLGVVLYEMISGQMPFKGDYEQAVIYSIQNEEPEPLTALRTGVPIALDGIIAKALSKEPKTRYQHVDELPADLKALDTAALSRSRISTQPQPSEGSKPSEGLRLPWTVAALLLVALVVTLIFVVRTKDSATPDAIRLNLSDLTSEEQSLFRADFQVLALSPDGNTLVYTLAEDGQSQLYLRSLNGFNSIPISGTNNAQAPFFSPDGQWIGFLADGKIKKVHVSGGQVETICDTPGFRGASWGPDNTIVFSPRLNSGLMVVSATGGAVRQISTLDSTHMERTHRWPQVLPDGKWVLYTIGDQNNPNSYVDARVAIQSLETGEQHILNVRGEMARYVEPGFLIIARNGTLLAAPFSLKDFKTTQPLVSVLNNVDGDVGSGISYFTLSHTGRLIYIPGTRNQDLELVWVDLQGKVEPLPLERGDYSEPRLSPNGGQLAVTVGRHSGGDYDIWLYNLKSDFFNRFTFGKRTLNPAWSPDGEKLYFGVNGSDNEGIWVKSTDGSSAKTLIFRNTGLPLILAYVTPDGSKLVLNRLSGPTEGDMLALDLIKKQEPYTLISSTFFGYSGNLTPDGRFLAYASSESGTASIFVTSFPALKGKWQIASGGPSYPIWSPDGKNLYYINSLAKMMAVAISTDPVFSTGKPRELFDVSMMSFPNTQSVNFDISPDGKRFIMLKNTRASAGTQLFNVILNWTEELRERLTGGE